MVYFLLGGSWSRRAGAVIFLFNPGPLLSPDRLHAESLRRRSGLAEARVFPRLRSTQARAAELVEAGTLKLPAAVIASRQTAGRGQRDNMWWSAPGPGSLAVTFIFPAPPAVAQDETGRVLPLRVGLVLLGVMASHVSAARLRLKWPNDLWADGRKLAGVLCQRVRGTDLIGIGINMAADFSHAPAEVGRRAISLGDISAKPPSRAELFVGLAIALRQELAAPLPRPGWHQELDRVHAFHKRPIAVNTGEQVLRGICEGIDSSGRLLLRDGAVLHRIISGRIAD